ncbi:MAG: hypothetical protein ACI8PZ_006539 [Myxococcota bacterium]|jgi:uncharacterized protein
MLLVLCATLAAAVTPQGVINPQADHRGWVSDMAGVIDRAAEAELEHTLEALHGRLGVEVAVVTVPETDLTPKTFATVLFEEWQLGDREANNGLLLLLVMDERRLEMETGYGIEPILPDSWLGQMQRSAMVPAFKEGDYGAGLLLGVNLVATRLDEFPEEARSGTRGLTITQRMRTATPGTAAAVGLGAAGGLVLLGGGVAVRRRRRRERTCHICNTTMPMLTEDQDDDHLNAVEQLEEAIGSVDYQVHACLTCDHVRTFRVGRWFSGFSRCPTCKAQTRSTSRVTEVVATQYSSGRARITEICANCDYHRSYTRIIARRSSSSGGSSGGGGSFGGGGGGSFGGGSSGGGGAGSSW